MNSVHKPTKSSYRQSARRVLKCYVTEFRRRQKNKVVVLARNKHVCKHSIVLKFVHLHFENSPDRSGSAAGLLQQRSPGWPGGTKSRQVKF